MLNKYILKRIFASEQIFASHFLIPANIPFKIFVLKRIIAEGQASVTDLGCLSRIPNLDFCPSRILSPRSKNSNKKRGVKTDLLSFFCSHKNHKIESYINFELVKK